MRLLLPLALLALVTAAVEAKSGRTYYTDAMVAQARQRVADLDWAAKLRDGYVANAAWLLELTDQQLWDLVPPAEQRRALNVSFGVGCPVHGEEVFRKGGHYPWIMSRDKPFKVTCPVGGESYPSNDYQPWTPGDGDPEQGDGYIDHGLGWQDAQGRRYWFVAYYIFWQRWQRDILPGISNLANAYLLTGDAKYAHACAILLDRIAVDWRSYHYQTQAYHNGGYPNHYPGRILDHIWSTGTVSNLASSYDAIYPALADDAALATFLKGQGIDEVKAHLEHDLLVPMIQDILEGTIRGNMGMHQQAVCRAAIVLDNDDPAAGPTKEQVVDWVMAGPGDVEQLLWNGFYRDGHGGESSPGYSSGWCANFYEVAQLLPMLGVDIWSNPKVKKMADIGLDLAVAGDWSPDIGDSGSIRGSHRVGWSAAVLAEAYRHYQDPRQAKALHRIGARTETLWDDSVDDQVDAVVQREGDEVSEGSHLVGGYGLAVLNSGAGDHRRGLSMYYGHAGGGHGHRDRLTIELWAHGRPMLTDMGYPAHWLAKNALWTSNTISHYDVLVDEQGQQTQFAAMPVALLSTPEVQFAEADASQVAYPGTADVYGRASALVDLDAEHFYLVDIFRVAGGRQHDWSFHGPAFFDLKVNGVDLDGPHPGTVAGEDVGFAKPIPRRVEGGGATLEAKDLDGVVNDQRPYADRSNEGWAYYTGTSILTRKVGSVARHRVEDLPAGEASVFLHAYDYNQGKNTVEVEVAGQTVTFTWGESGETGYHWLGPEKVTLPGGPGEVVLTAKEQGQNYILLDSLSIGQGDRPPTVHDATQSGFNYLKSPRYGKPAGAWSASWTKADEGLFLDLHVPDGCVQELIQAQAEPELTPGAPESMDYLLGRNVAADDEALTSTYVAVVEAGQGEPAITGVRRLPLAGAPAQAVALAVEHSGGTDLVYCSPDPLAEATVTWAPGQELQVRGRFVRATFRDGKIVSTALLEDGRLVTPDATFDGGASAQGELTAVNVAANQVTVAGAPAKAEDWVGRTVIFGNDQHATAYTVQGLEVQGDQAVLDLGDTLLRVGMGLATGVDEAARKVSTSTQFVGYGRVDGGRHQGRWLLNEALAYGPRIGAVSGNAVVLEPGGTPLEPFLSDADGDGRTRFWIADVGPGDTYRVGSVAAVTPRPGWLRQRWAAATMAVRDSPCTRRSRADWNSWPSCAAVTRWRGSSSSARPRATGSTRSGATSTSWSSSNRSRRSRIRDVTSVCWRRWKACSGATSTWSSPPRSRIPTSSARSTVIEWRSMRDEQVVALIYDIRRACDALAEFAAGKTLEDYLGDLLLRSGVERQFGIMARPWAKR